MKRFIVAGSRNFSDEAFTYYVLDKFEKSPGAKYFLQAYDHDRFNVHFSFGLETNDRELAESKVEKLNTLSNLLK
jgi:hypothetical protein